MEDAALFSLGQEDPFLLSKFAVSWLQGLQLLGHINRNARPLATVDLRLLDRTGAKTGTLAAHLNAELAGTPAAGAYDGPWAFATLGGAGGQTVFGALTTGTHGGDYRQQPISDSVVAVHLVTDGGDHYWIEPRDSRNELLITDDGKLQRHYGSIAGTRFSIIRDSAIFDAAVISGGRFGVIASLVLRVVPQYCLHEHRVLETWSQVKQLLSGPQQHHVFDPVYFPPDNRPAAQAEFLGRFGNFAAIEIGFYRSRSTRARITSTSIASASRSAGSLRTLHPKRRIQMAACAVATSVELRAPLERPFHMSRRRIRPSQDRPAERSCRKRVPMATSSPGCLNEAADALQEIIDDGFVPATGIVALASGLGPAGLINPITDICLILKLLVELLRALADDVEASGDISLTQVVNATIASIMNNPDIPRPVAILTIRMIFLMIFESQQSKRDFVALSYAVMDTHDYKDRSCFGNAQSIEVFFDARRPDIYCAYVDQVLAFEAAQQENDGRFTAGYVSLRYVRGSQGLSHRRVSRRHWSSKWPPSAMLPGASPS